MIETFRVRHPGVELVLANAETFRLVSTFDVIIVNNVVQYLDPEAIRPLLANLAAMLSNPGLSFLGDIPNRALRACYRSDLFRSDIAARKPLALLTGWDALASLFRPALDRIGYWCDSRLLLEIADDLDLRSSILGSILYPYRFSAVLTRGAIS